MGVVRYIIALWLIFAGEGDHSPLMVFSLLILVPYTVVTDGFASVIKYGRILYITDDEIMSVFGWLIRFVHDCYLRIVKKISGESNDGINKNTDYDEESGVELTVTNPMLNIGKEVSVSLDVVGESSSDVVFSVNPSKVKFEESLLDVEIKSDRQLQSIISNDAIHSDVYSLPADPDSTEVCVETISSSYYEKSSEAVDVSMAMNPMIENACRQNISAKESTLSLPDEYLSRTLSEVRDDTSVPADEPLYDNHTEAIVQRLSVPERSSMSGGRGRLGLGRQGGRGGRGRGSEAMLNEEGKSIAPVSVPEEVVSYSAADVVRGGRGGGRGGRSSASFSAASDSILGGGGGGRSGRGGHNSASGGRNSASGGRNSASGGRSSASGGRSSASFTTPSIDCDQAGRASGRGGRSGDCIRRASAVHGAEDHIESDDLYQCP